MWKYVEIWEKYAKTCKNMQTNEPPAKGTN